jgi:hypothetical protein
MRLLGDMLFEYLHQAAFAYTSLTTQEHHVSVSTFHLLPTLQEQSNFLFPTDQWGQTTSTGDVQPTLGTTLAQDSVDGDGLRNTSECLCS